MGAIGDDEAMQWEKMEALETAGSDASAKVEKIVVTVRLRPLSVKEIAANDPADWECINDTTIMFRNSLNERSMAPTAYTFDRVFGGECSTRQVYEEGAKEVALQVVSGINSTIFAYGQTSSGKTYTMTGIAEYTVADIYNYIQKHEERAFVLKFSAIEIYNEAVRDLLTVDDTPLRVLDDPERGISVEKLTEVLLKDWNHLKELLAVCEGQRRTGETLLNEMSSRSHQILRLTINSSAREFLGKDNPSTLAASVNFVDLAGSERASQALSVGNRLKEGCHINRSLLTLGTVIRKLSKGRNGHIPYRDSKLTRILQPSLGGNARTAIICTMSPARSYIEQSRNTLLFASCAKEVMTSARVNVVISDRALVKHLQKELARLEDELKCPRTNSVTSHYQALLREKDARIKKMEEEIKELVHERELAQSRVEDLLRVVGSNRPSSQWEESCQMSTSRSSVAYHDPDFGSTKFAAYARDNENGNPEARNALAPRHSINSPVFSAAIPHQREEVNADGSFEDSEDLYKDVRCIEMERSVGSGDPRSLLEEGTEMDGPVGSRDSNSFPEEGSGSFLQQTSYSTRHEDPELNKQMGLRPPRPTITLEQHLQDVRERLKNFVRVHPDESSPWTTSDLSRSRESTFSRSRSCRESLIKNSSGWFEETEQNVSTPPRGSHKDLTGRTERFQNRCLALNYGVIGTPSRVGTETFESSTSIAGESVTSASNGGITSIHDFVAGLKMAQVQYQKQLNGSQETEQNAIEDFGDEATARDIGLDPIVDPKESPSRWPLEFEKQQRDIIDLWHACNVSLAHRTYFFMLFKGDPMDSIYMEVELRRLSFLKRTVASGNFDMKAAKGSNLVSSAKKLQREREMLCRQLQKRYTAEERESLYTKWGIALDSKQRKVQLVRCLWTKTGNLEHVRESATIVAKLIGLLKEGQALREMFGLSFAPEQCYSMPSRWKYGIASFK